MMAFDLIQRQTGQIGTTPLPGGVLVYKIGRANNG